MFPEIVSTRNFCFCFLTCDDSVKRDPFYYLSHEEEKFEDTTRVIKNRKSEKDNQYNDKQKQDNDLQKTIDSVSVIHLQFLNHIISIKIKVILPRAGVIFR